MVNGDRDTSHLPKGTARKLSAAEKAATKSATPENVRKYRTAQLKHSRKLRKALGLPEAKAWLGDVKPSTVAFRKVANRFRFPIKIPKVKGRSNPINKEGKLRDEEKNDAPSITKGMSESIYIRIRSLVETEMRKIT